MNSKTGRNVLYPFVPQAETHRTMLAAIKDCFAVVSRNGSTLGGGGNIGYLAAITAGVADVEYEFRFESAQLTTSIAYLTCPRNIGTTRISSIADGLHLHLIVDMNNMPAVGTYALGKTARLEPARIIWQTTELRSISLFNETMRQDPATRTSGLSMNSVVTLTGGTLRLKNGYNCEVAYSEETETLTIRGAAGIGAGLVPASGIPWDVRTYPAPPASGGLFSINGVEDVDGNITLEGSSSVQVGGSTGNRILIRVYREMKAGEEEPAL